MKQYNVLIFLSGTEIVNEIIKTLKNHKDLTLPYPDLSKFKIYNQ